MASIENNRDLVLLAEQTANHPKYSGGATAIVGRDGIIQQLAEAVNTVTEPGEFETQVYVMLIKMDGSGFEIIKDSVLFNTIGGFEQNLVRYGIK